MRMSKQKLGALVSVVALSLVILYLLLCPPIRVLVTDLEGNPIRHATVTVTWKRYLHLFFFMGHLGETKKVVTNSQGKVTVYGVPRERLKEVNAVDSLTHRDGFVVVDRQERFQSSFEMMMRPREAENGSDMESFK